MKKKSFLLIASLALVSTLGLSTLASCGETSSVAPSTSAPDTPTSSAPVSSSSSTSVDEKPVVASGAFSYAAADYQQKTEILGKLESYAYNNFLTGLPLFENGGYVMYNSRLVKGTENYVPGYGFGILSEGSITADMESETNVNWKRYLHSVESSDPANINALNADGSQVLDLYSYIGGSYWSTKLNETKDGYDWYGDLAKDNRPIPVDADYATNGGLSQTWKFRVRTKKDGLAYRTSSASLRAKGYDNKGIELEDYVNAFKVLLTKKNNLYRGAELANASGYSSISGAKSYFNASADGFNEEAWAGVGIKGYEEDGEAWLEIKLGAPTTQFYAMYALSSSLYTPIPTGFIEDIGGIENYGSYSNDKSLTPVDTILCVGPYYLETWVDQQAIVFKRNENWFGDNVDGMKGRYKIPGVKVTVLKAATTDPNAVFNEFLAGNLDSASIPQDFLSQYKSDPRTTTVTGDSVFKLNINSCTEEQWIEKFGEEGEIATTPESEYWDVKPWMSNKDFLKGLLFSIDRETIATNHGSISSCDYFGSAYMSDPENGKSYNATEEHKQALIDAGFETEESIASGDRLYGYNTELSKNLFDSAIDTMLADGSIKKGDTLNIDIWWMYESQITTYGAEIKSFVEPVFNNAPKAKANNLTLSINNYGVSVWSDVYYKHLMIGQFDLGFGSISGNTLNPLNFMEVLKSNNSSGFTLNWGPDTSVLDESLVYDGKIWSYDTLWKAGDTAVLLNEGAELEPCVTTYGKEDWFKVHEDKSITVTFEYQMATEIKGIDWSNCDLELVIFNVWDGNKINAYLYPTELLEETGCDSFYKEVTYAEDSNSVTFTTTPVFGEYLLGLGYFLLESYTDVTVNGYTSPEVYSYSSVLFPSAE